MVAMGAQHQYSGEGFSLVQFFHNAIRVIVWLCLSSGVVLSNKWLMHPKRFPFPVSLTCCHMAVSALAGAFAVKSGMTTKQKLSWKMWAKFCLPVGALSASALFFGNVAFLYLTVSFMQMLKANLPVLVFVVGCLFASEVFTISSFANMIVIAAGVALASYGEVGFSVSGVVCMFSGMCCEAVRLTLIQTLLQRQDLHMNPLSTLYYIMPISLLCLLPLACISEARALQDCTFLTYDSLPAFLANVCCAVALNLSSYIVVGTMSALTMKLAAIVKDIGLVAVSCIIFGDILTFPGVAGYSVALLGICTHNYRRLQLYTVPVVNQDLCAKQAPNVLHLKSETDKNDWQIPTVGICSFNHSTDKLQDKSPTAGSFADIRGTY